MTAPRTLFEKIWSDHVIVMSPQGEALLYVDFNLINEGQSFLAFDQLRMEGRQSRRPQQHLAVTDHYLPTINRERGTAGMANAEIRRVVEMMDENARDFRLPHVGWFHRDQGIAHVIAPELGISQPGMLITCNDLHTATNGACGALAVPIGGGNQLRHVVATQTVWLKKPKTHAHCDRRRTAEGGDGERHNSFDHPRHRRRRRHRLCCGIFRLRHPRSVDGGPADDLQHVDRGRRPHRHDRARRHHLPVSLGRRYAPKGADWDKALAHWRTLPSDAGATFDRELSFDAARLAPMVSWGTSPEDSAPIDSTVPDPSRIDDADRRRHVERALDYMQLRPATPLAEVSIDRVFIGSCTNSRIEDLRAAALVLKGRRAAVPGMVSPGSSAVKRQAEAEGLDRIFIEAGLEWRDSGCSMCNGSNGELVAPGERCASTTNRNYEGRQGRGALTHIMSPAMVAAAAVFGRLADVRQLS